MMKIELNMKSMKAGVIKAMLIWEEEAKRICNKKTLAMTRSIKSIVREFLDVYVGIIGTRNNMLRRASKFHYPFSVHDGHKAFTIKPGSRGFLAFPVNQRTTFMSKKGTRLKKARAENDWAFTKKPINIPATKGNPFFITSYHNVESKMDRLILEGVKLK